MRGLALAATTAVTAIAAPADNGFGKTWGDPGKIVRFSFRAAETGFDPQAVSDLYSSDVNRLIFDTLYQFDYLARPYKVVPNAAAGMPEISADGKVWTIKVKPGSYFSDDPAFGGKKRELTAHDFVFSWKRLLDPRVRSSYLWLLEGKVVGMDEVVAAANKAGGKFNYDTPVEGLRALDRYTLRLELKQPDYVLIQYMSHPSMAAVAREVIEKYGDPHTTQVMDRPVGSGPYRLVEWKRSAKTTLEANPNFREEYFAERSDDPNDAPLIAQMRGKRLPQIGRIEISILEESNPRLLAFDAMQHDYLEVPRELTTRVIEKNRLRVSYANRDVRWVSTPEPALAYSYFNMEDPVVGGYGREKIALRRAITMGLNTPEEVTVVRQGQAVAANQPVPPTLGGYVPGLKGKEPYNAAAARALLDRFEYKDCDGDGYRELPGCKPLVLEQASQTDSEARLLDELWKKSMDAIGIKIVFRKGKFAENLKAGKEGKLQMWRVGWISSIADGDSFMALLHSKTIGQSNYSRFNMKQYDALYERSKTLPDGPERAALYRKMAKLVVYYAPWDMGVIRIENNLAHPWMLGYKKHALYKHPVKYFDIDTGLRKKLAGH